MSSTREANDTSVQVAVRIRPLVDDELEVDNIHYISANSHNNQVFAGSDTTFTFDHVFGPDSTQQLIYDQCVVDLVNAAFEGFNATVLAYGQTGSGKTWTMGSSSDMPSTDEMMGIIPRVINTLFETVQQREADDANTSYKILVQFIEIYGEDIRDLLDHTKTSKVSIRESVGGDVFISGAKEEFVGSTVQMFKALEDGSRHRTTASTRMNAASSRSHAIFTVILEQTQILDQPEGLNPLGDVDGALNTSSGSISVNVTQPRAEVRKSKFHFVDLAGSERAKRTGAHGQQLKEGIDINKGLLALGNVISALGDETKRGKVHVPYRDSKLTRLLQDSLGGNSKTLFICCVSPAGVNFVESLNALRYANRARNIKNKPVVNRDPTMVMVDELKGLIQVLGKELVLRRRAPNALEASVLMSALGPQYLSDESLDDLVVKTASAGHHGNIPIRPNIPSGSAAGSRTSAPIGYAGSTAAVGGPSSRSLLDDGSPSAASRATDRPIRTGSPSYSSGTSRALQNQQNVDLQQMKRKLQDSDKEIARLTNQLKLARMQTSEEAERIVLIESERDFFKMKWAAECPQEFELLESAELDQTASDGSEPLDESTMQQQLSARTDKKEFMRVISGYLREIESLKRELAEWKVKKSTLAHADDIEFLSEEALLENELSSSVARVIAQTQEHLRLETIKLKSAGSIDDADIGNERTILPADPDRDLVDGDGSDENRSPEAEERAFQQRQKQLSSELQHIGESIQLKEQLVQQLQRSQYQYTVMKAFYEQKLQALEEEMAAKHAEREQLVTELQELMTKAEAKPSANKQDREIKLREELKRRDDELKALKKKQDDLNNLSQVQSRYLRQVSKLEAEIETMKKTRVDLTKLMHAEKRKHIQALNDKAKEIERLKRELAKSIGEVKGLKRDKERAEERTKEALREGSMLRRRATELLRFTGSGDASATSARNAKRAMNSSTASASTGKAVAPTRILSEDQIKTKRWLENHLTELNQRERASEELRRHCEFQLSLVGQQESLKLRLAQLPLHNSTSEGDVESSTISNERRELEEKIEAMNEQLKIRNSKIFDMQQQLAAMDEKMGDEKALDHLKKVSATSLTAAQDLIRLMFEMLLSSRRAISNRSELLSQAEVREKRLKQELEQASSKMIAAERYHETELTRVLNDYEEKLSGLFCHSAVGQTILAESGLEKASDHAASHSGKSAETGSVQSYKMLLAVSTEQLNSLRVQLAREEQVTSELKYRIEELELNQYKFHRELEDKNATIAFLEDERHLFKNLTDDFRAIILAMGGSIGESIVQQVKEKTIEKSGVTSLPNAHHASIFLEDDSSDDDDSASVQMAYNMIAEEITKTGRVVSDSTVGKAVVYDRLTNPSNFTGSMKNVFEQDLAVKRQKVQKIKRQESGRGGSRKEAFTAGSQASSQSTTARSLEKLDIPSLSSLSSDGGDFGFGGGPLSPSADQLRKGTLVTETGEARRAPQPPKTIVHTDSRLNRFNSLREVFANQGDTEVSGASSSQSEEPQDVFSRLSKSYTGIHKHIHADAPPSSSDSHDFRGVIEGIGYRNIDLTMLESTSAAPSEDSTANSNVYPAFSYSPAQSAEEVVESIDDGAEYVGFGVQERDPPVAIPGRSASAGRRDVESKSSSSSKSAIVGSTGDRVRSNSISSLPAGAANATSTKSKPNPSSTTHNTKLRGQINLDLSGMEASPDRSGPPSASTSRSTGRS